MIKEHDRVVLTVPVSTERLEAGDVGTVVHVYRDGQAYEVEFLTLVSLLRSNARNSVSMFVEPLSHVLIGPHPFKRMSIEPVVLGPADSHMLDELLPALPGASPQVTVTERIDQQFGLIEPGGMHWREAGSPPIPSFGPVSVGIAGRVAGIAILNQEDPFQVAMTSPKGFQLLDVMGRIFLVQNGQLHEASVDNQKQQHVDRPMADILELPLLDRTRNRPSDWRAFQDLEIRDLVDRHGPEALPGQAGSIAVAPEYFFGSLLELSIQVRRLPIPRAMRVQVDLLQNPTHHAGANGRDNSLGHGLAGQIAAGPVSDVQALGNGLQAGQFDDLCSLERGKSAGDGLSGVCLSARLPGRLAHNGGTPARQWPHRTASGRPPVGCVVRQPRPKRCGRVALGTRASSDCEQSHEASQHRQKQSLMGKVFGRASGKLQRLLSLHHSWCPEFLALLRSRDTRWPHGGRSDTGSFPRAACHAARNHPRPRTHLSVGL